VLVSEGPLPLQKKKKGRDKKKRLTATGDNNVRDKKIRDVAIHAQYGQPMTVRSELVRVANVYPSAVFLIHYTLHYHHHLLATLLLFGLSAIGGSYMIYIMNKLSYLLVMRRVPSLGALWIFAVVRLHLSHALLSLLLVALWVWIMDLSLYV